MENSDSYIFLDDQITQKTRFYTDPIDIITIYDSNSIRVAMQKLLHYKDDLTLEELESFWQIAKKAEKNEI